MFLGGRDRDRLLRRVVSIRRNYLRTMDLFEKVSFFFWFFFFFLKMRKVNERNKFENVGCSLSHVPYTRGFTLVGRIYWTDSVCSSFYPISRVSNTDMNREWKIIRRELLRRIVFLILFVFLLLFFSFRNYYFLCMCLCVCVFFLIIIFSL